MMTLAPTKDAHDLYRSYGFTDLPDASMVLVRRFRPADLYPAQAE